MEETIKFICKKTLKWIWIPALAAVICGIATIMFQNKSVDPKPSLKEYNMDWEVFPEAHRYAIYTIQIKPDTLKRADPNSEPLSYLNQYGELIRQRIMSISNINSIYNALIDQYGVLFPDYSSNKMLNEMIALMGGAGDYDLPDMAGMLKMVYRYASGSEYTDPSGNMSVENLINYLADAVENNPAMSLLISADMKAGITDARDQLEEGKKQLVTDDHSRMIIISGYAAESPETTAFLADLTQKCDTLLDGEYYMIGNSAMTYEMQQSFRSELLFITLLTAAAIFLIVALTFRSLLIPLMLVLLVQSGVYGTVSFIGVRGESIYYLALVIVECILMGATIDYGILFTNYYRENRRTMGIKDALCSTYEKSTHTILTSGTILILVPALLGVFWDDPTIAAILGAIATGALFAVLLILFALPGLLAVCDRAIVKKADRYVEGEDGVRS